jgi:hypothetical protein
MQDLVVRQIERVHDIANRWHLIGVTAHDEVSGRMKIAGYYPNITLAALRGRFENRAKLVSYTLGICIGDVHGYRPVLNLGFKLRAVAPCDQLII